MTVQTVKPTFDCQRACAVSQETRDSELAFGQHGRSWTRTAGSSDTSGSPFPPLLSLWITPHQLHKTHFTSRSHHSPSRRGSRGEKNQERCSESSPKSAESPEPFWSSRRSRAARRKRLTVRQPWSPGKKPASLCVCGACGGRGGFRGRWCQHTLAAVGMSTPDRRPSPTIPVICPRTNVF